MTKSKDVHVFEPLQSGVNLLKNITTRDALKAQSTFFMARIRKAAPDDYLITAGNEHYGMAFKINLNDHADFLCVTMPLKLYSPPSMLSSC